jgi:hypothetical protein
MKLDYFFYQVQTEVVFTEADVDAAMRCSQRHYDAKCRSLSEVGGFLYGMKNQVRGEAGATRGFSCQELDTLQKVLEQAQGSEEVSLYHAVREVFASARKESERVNANSLPAGAP